MLGRDAVGFALTVALTACGGSGAGTPGGASTGDPAAGTCTGPVPSHATLCPGTDQGLARDAARVVTGSSCACAAPCAVTPCSYACDAGWVLEAGACVPAPPADPPVRFSDAGDGTVAMTDAMGRLVWLRDAACTETAGGVSRADETLAWPEAMAWAGALASGTCGLRDGSAPGDWRLPTQGQLMRLQVGLAAATPFVRVQAGAYWSSFTYFADKAGAVDMTTGQYFDYVKELPFHVWPVRQ